MKLKLQKKVELRFMLNHKQRQTKEFKLEIKIKVFRPNLRVLMLWHPTIEDWVKFQKKQQKPKDLKKSKLQKIELNDKKKRNKPNT